MNTHDPISRRHFLARSSAAAAGVALASLPSFAVSAAERKSLPEPTAKKLPRWRGFNLLEKFNGRNDPFVEQDFAWIAEMGFNFVRLPMDYRGWVEKDDWTKFREPTLKEIDEAIRFGEKHGIHVHLNFHRAPGYTVARPPEAKSVWTDEEALRVCALHWATFARRYRGIPNRQLSFNPFNEPARLEPEVHKRVIARIVEAVREHDAQRLVICDGRDWGNEPPTELAGLGVAAATRGYRPMRITHYKASWVGGADQWAEPSYPLKEGETTWDKATMRQKNIEPWQKLEQAGVGVMVGEFGAFNKTPHQVVLAWMRECLDLWKEAGWGWAMWNLRGGFGVLDSGRADVAYEDWRGHKLDRAMLELIRAA
ncbi:MAG: cellulase family glycosylhydrolase [Verrucomicrobia bacterium]|nr:cellulase family glycosylhydrolase [Verrucomicrobiota bacterium]